MDWNVGDLERSVSGGPIRSEKMRSDEFISKKMDSTDDHELIFGLGDPIRSVSGGPIRSEKMDSSNNLTPLIFGPEPVVITTNESTVL